VSRNLARLQLLIERALNLQNGIARPEAFVRPSALFFYTAFFQMPSKKGTGSETAYSFFTAFSS
jgi:hypothetical protein